MSLILGILILIIVMATLYIVMSHFERKFFNDGICRKCGGEFKYVTSNSQGGYLIECVDCGTSSWFSYTRVVTLEERREKELQLKKIERLRKERGLD